jgi:hypothetical protein
VSNSWSNAYDTFKGDSPYQSAPANPNVAWSASNYDIDPSQKPRVRAWTDNSMQSVTYEAVPRGHYDIIEQSTYDVLDPVAAYDTVVEGAPTSKGHYHTLGNYDDAEASTDYDAGDAHIPAYDRADADLPEPKPRHNTVYLSPQQSGAKPVLRLQDVYY